MKTRFRAAFTIIELLVVVSIIALLVGILLPAVGKARDQAKLTMSQANLRNIGVAHQSYASEWGDRQFTLINDSLSSYGNNINAFDAYYQSNGGVEDYHCHPGPILGWGYLEGNPANAFVRFGYFTHEGGGSEGHSGTLQAANSSLNLPINFGSLNEFFGAFRLINVAQFHQYVSGKFYDKVFYAPKDDVVIGTITGGGFNGQNCFDDPGQYCDRPDISGQGEIPVWSSYCLSAAAMYNPQVMAHPDPEGEGGGWKDPWELPGAFRSPSLSQTLFPSLKTQTLEHHWLQSRAVECSPSYNIGTYMGGTCEPFYFNQAWVSSPVTLFYDGHVAPVGTREAMRADGRVREQTRNDDWGLWSNDTPWGSNGYLSDYGYDQANTSYHVLTTDGIRGRDVTD